MLALCALVAARAQEPSENSSTHSPLSPAGLAERQRGVQERMQRLESTMLRLSKLLAQSEPEKAERLKDGLDQAGKQRLRARVEQLVGLLRRGALSEADREQEKVLADLDSLLRLLTSPMNELDARRAERQRLEALKRTIRKLIEEQTENVYRTQHAEQRFQSRSAEADGESGPTPESAELARKLEQAQRETQRKTAEVHREMKAKPGDSQPDRPGAPSVAQAGQEMRAAAERLGDARPDQARPHQQEALDKLQQAVDELDDALRQVRKEEIEETLAALSTRLASLLAREKEIRQTVQSLSSTPAADWSRTQQMQAAEAAEAQSSALDECNAAARLLTDEGSTVLFPELLRQLAQEMSAVAARLRRPDVSAGTLQILDDIIASLEEMLAAVEQRRDNPPEPPPPGPDSPPPAPSDAQTPLLPKSAELKLMKSAQLRINARMPSEAEALEGPAPELEDLAARQRRLAELALRMSEGK